DRQPPLVVEFGTVCPIPDKGSFTPGVAGIGVGHPPPPEGSDPLSSVRAPLYPTTPHKQGLRPTFPHQATSPQFTALIYKPTRARQSTAQPLSGDPSTHNRDKSGPRSPV